MLARLFDRNAELAREAEAALRPPPRPNLRQVASEAPTNQLIAVLADEVRTRSDVDPVLLRDVAHLLDRWADELEREAR